MALMGRQTEPFTRSVRDNKASLPSIIALLAVAVLWAAGAISGISYLAEESSPLAMLTGLYVGLAAVAVSIIITTLALNNLAGRYSHQRTKR
jgi:hypothetical protein